MGKLPHNGFWQGRQPPGFEREARGRAWLVGRGGRARAPPPAVHAAVAAAGRPRGGWLGEEGKLGKHTRARGRAGGHLRPPTREAERDAGGKREKRGACGMHPRLGGGAKRHTRGTVVAFGSPLAPSPCARALPQSGGPALLRASLLAGEPLGGLHRVVGEDEVGAGAAEAEERLQRGVLLIQPPALGGGCGRRGGRGREGRPGVGWPPRMPASSMPARLGLDAPKSCSAPGPPGGSLKRSTGGSAGAHP
jgi:hypothetical protein